MTEHRDDRPTSPDEVQRYYAEFPEESRLSSGPSRLEFERTKDVLTPGRGAGARAGAVDHWSKCTSPWDREKAVMKSVRRRRNTFAHCLVQ